MNIGFQRLGPHHVAGAKSLRDAAPRGTPMQPELGAEPSATVAPGRPTLASFKLLGESCLVLADAGARDGSVLIGELRLHGRRFVVALNAARAGLPPRPGLRRLTRREREIAILIAQGCLTKQVAHELGLSPHTVTAYVHRIFAKLSVHNRAEMVSAVFTQLTPQGAPAGSGEAQASAVISGERPRPRRSAAISSA